MSLLPSPCSASTRLLLKSSNPSNLRRHQIAPPRASPSSHGIRSQLDSAALASTVGYPPLVILGRKHITSLNVAACAVAISTTWLFLWAIPSLLAFKRAAESMEKVLDVTTEELPNTMAAVRLSGMEISDLTMELSNIGQEITQGVRSSTQTIRLAEDRLRQLTTMAHTVPVQGQALARDETEVPEIAKTARKLREGIVKGRAALGVIFGVTRFSRWALNFLSARKQKRSL